MRKDLTELVFIIDRSGSMYPLVSDTIGGFNQVLASNKELPGECMVTTILFHSSTEVLHDHLPIRGIPPLTKADYRTNGATALLDAIGEGIEKLDGIRKHTLPEERAEKVQFVIITDGLENASARYDLGRVRRLVSARQEEGWDFIFLGANIDAIQVAGSIGIHPDRAVEAVSDGQGLRLSYAAVTEANRALRTRDDRRSADWKSKVEADTRSRGRRPSSK